MFLFKISPLTWYRWWCRQHIIFVILTRRAAFSCVTTSIRLLRDARSRATLLISHVWCGTWLELDRLVSSSVALLASMTATLRVLDFSSGRWYNKSLHERGRLIVPPRCLLGLLVMMAIRLRGTYSSGALPTADIIDVFKLLVLHRLLHAAEHQSLAWVGREICINARASWMAPFLLITLVTPIIISPCRPLNLLAPIVASWIPSLRLLLGISCRVCL